MTLVARTSICAVRADRVLFTLLPLTFLVCTFFFTRSWKVPNNGLDSVPDFSIHLSVLVFPEVTIQSAILIAADLNRPGFSGDPVG